MKNSRRKLLISLGAITTITGWTQPIIKTVILPAHAEMSDFVAGVDYAVIASNVVCNGGDPTLILFDLTNNETKSVTITELGEIDTLQHISPPLPFTINPGASLNVVIESSESNISICGALVAEGFFYVADSANSTGATESFLF